MNQKTLFATFCLSFCIMTTLLAGCGSSSSPASINGVFRDADVVGASFACGTQKGVTGTGGTLTCPAASTVTISVGGITLCTQTAQALITPLSCVQATDPTANTSTPAVVAIAQFLMSINTTTIPSQASPSTITITSAELTAANGLTLDFATATQAQLQAAVATTTGNPAAVLVSQAAAQAEITATVLGALAGKKFTGTYTGGSSGTWTVTIASDGTVSGTFNDNSGKSGTVSGSLTSGTTYTGTAGTASWTGTLDTSKTPVAFSGTWTDTQHGTTGNFMGTETT